ncbi:DUF6438 domain-containing protein [Marivirga tractuosa]|uniref:DUF6438 domain-containing protein n=1 Tax=Marivirga tractuosa TaxID=1006 RepID=UPI0035CFEDA1
MNIFKYNYVSILFVFCLMVSCKTNSATSSQKVEEIFSLNTTSCMGPCPVFELSLYGDKKLVFNGKENTEVSGEHEVVLTDDQFESLLGIIESADWVNLDKQYKSNMMDLPTQKFTYNRKGVSKSVSRYGAGPESISNMSDTILTFVEEQVFNK